ncbi:hypothetical protein DFJ77DRAFT_43634 [Powellomyces hirtus]|nr:hypothetical protein DFJ77DRAFT_43634 [Powellomyces hirtus]
MASVHTLSLGPNIVDNQVIRFYLPTYTPAPPLPPSFAYDGHLICSKTDQAQAAFLVFLCYVPQVRLTPGCSTSMRHRTDVKRMESCVVCGLLVLRGIMIIERVVVPVRDKYDGLTFRLHPRMLCPGCTPRLYAGLKETPRHSPVNTIPPRPLHHVWDDALTRGLLHNYAHWWFGIFGRMSQKRVRAIEDDSFSKSSAGGHKGWERIGLTVCFGVCSRCRKPCKWKCSRCWSAYYCGRTCQRKDWIVHRSDCVERPRATESGDADDDAAAAAGYVDDEDDDDADNMSDPPDDDEDQDQQEDDEQQQQQGDAGDLIAPLNA